MKTCKLWVHKDKDFEENDLVLRSKDFPDLTVGDVVEIYQPEDIYRRLLVKIKEKSFNEDLMTKEPVISIHQSIATLLKLKNIKNICINPVDPKNVSLDLVEFVYKEQYFNRSDMYRLRGSLFGDVLQLDKKVTFAGMRAQVSELWSKGEQVASGVMTKETRVAFRSSTAQINIFIQMSSEMWEFDNYGDLFFEKSVSGFLTELFARWKEKNCSHDVTVTLFSRTFYEARTIDDFPMHMRECVQQDYQGRFYEDFYRVVVQNERYEDWQPTIIELKELFHQYPNRVLHCHQKSGIKVPVAWNSTAADGNFLEVLNMALNVFEKFYLDRCLDRTGKLTLIITPGSGVFNVDRELTNITKQRTIDCGNSSDLVCMGEQPLHAVPLFKFHNKNPSRKNYIGDDYNIPHWINYSFYISKRQKEVICSGKFIPRIKIPTSSPMSSKEEKLQFSARKSNSQFLKKTSSQIMDAPAINGKNTEFPFHDFEDFDAYDAEVFKLPNKRVSLPSMSGQLGSKGISEPSRLLRYQDRIRRIRCKSDMYDFYVDRDLESKRRLSMEAGAIDIPRTHSESEEYMSNSFGGQSTSRRDNKQGTDYIMRPVVGSAGSQWDPLDKPNPLIRPRPYRALINPFAPSRLHYKVTSNRRRWAHAFPTDVKGASMQPHHQPGGSDNQLTFSPKSHDLSIQGNLLTSTVQKKARSSDSSFQGDVDHHSSFITKHKTLNLTLPDESYGPSSDHFKEASVHFGLPNSRSDTSIKTLDSCSSASSVLPPYEVGDAPRMGGRIRSSSLGLAYSRSPSYNKDMVALGLAQEEGHNWLWGITGEQEWTPDTTTGMDWKSMTLPVTLPITTDFFPDKRSLNNDYNISNYTLLPEIVTKEIWSTRSNVRRPLTPKEVYKEMVLQRLSQGFQLVLVPKMSRISDMMNISGSSPYPGSSLVAKSSAEQNDIEENILSIGRIFHKLTLNGSTIIVTPYWPRHPHPQKCIHYTYRFQVPDSDRYDVSWTNFTNQKLENYNWSYVDHYICSRGEEEYKLMESLKYWRARYFLLPSNNPATKMILDGTSQRCDIYEQKNEEEQQSLIESFVRFIEIMNKIKRPTIQNRSGNQTSLTRRNSGAHDVNPKLKAALSLSVTDSPVGSLIGSKISANSVTDEKAGSVGTPNKTLEGLAAQPENQPDTLSFDSPIQLIVERMLDQSQGLTFLQKQGDLARLPHHTFVAAEAVTWAKANVQGVNNNREAVQLMQTLLDEKMISHASGNQHFQFIHGFYLYHITPLVALEKTKESESLQPSKYYYNTYFQYEWCEVGIQETPVILTSDSAVPSFLEDFTEDDEEEQSRRFEAEDKYGNHLCQMTIAGNSQTDTGELQPLDTARSRYLASSLFKTVNVDIDASNRSDKQEWGTTCYHGMYNPQCAFELEIQWLVATGCVLADLVSTWSRKANWSGTGSAFHLLPVPGDPFALPFNANSDPLRGPIFIPLHIEYLKENGKELFEGFESCTWEKRLLIFQESILRRYGFIRDRPFPGTVPGGKTKFFADDIQLQYVHVTGGMFVLIPDNKTSSPLNLDGTHRRPVVGSYKDYITWHRGRTSSKSLNSMQSPEESRVGFLWAWNFMLTKRWRTANTGDENFQDKVLADFRAFCSNEDNRLIDYWTSLKEKANSKKDMLLNMTKVQ